jgi:hypothetical protein
MPGYLDRRRDNCMDRACSAIPNYPFGDPSACLAACAGFSDDELNCFGAYCEEAAMAVSGREHLCEHAWGGLGTAECR